MMALATLQTLAANLNTPSPRYLLWLKRLLFVVCLLPLLATAWQVLGGYAVNPVERITRDTGTWTLNFLLITLTVSPLRALGAPGWLLRLRRMLGLYAFFYGCVHLLTYLLLDQFFDWTAIGHDIIKRPFITVGMAAFALMLPLAITSSDGWMRRLKRNWGKLHRLIYPLTILGVVHYWWLVKRDLSQPILYAVLLSLLLGWRVWRYLRPTLAAKQPAKP